MSASDYRARGFHAACGARIFISFVLGDRRPRYFASNAANARETDTCPVCRESLFLSIRHEYSAAQEDTSGAHYDLKTTVLTEFEMEQRYLAARERLCDGAPLDAEAIVCMSAELEEGLTLEELAPLYGRDAETLRGEIAAFTAATTITP